MRAFEVYFNSEKVCTGDVPEGIAMVNVSHIAAPGQPATANAHVSAVGNADDNPRPVWWNIPVLCIGDEITVRFVEAEAADPPASPTQS
jgi:hypothetical protein